MQIDLTPCITAVLIQFVVFSDNLQSGGNSRSGMIFLEGAISLARHNVYGRLLIHFLYSFSWIPALAGMTES